MRKLKLSDFYNATSRIELRESWGVYNLSGVYNKRDRDIKNKFYHLSFFLRELNFTQ